MVKRRRASGAGDERGAGARGAPAPFTEREVEALREGNLDEARVAFVLEGHEQPETAEPSPPEKMAPVDLDEEALGRLAGGSTPAPVRKALEAAGKKDRDRAIRIDERQERPSKKPLRMGRA